MTLKKWWIINLILLILIGIFVIISISIYHEKSQPQIIEKNNNSFKLSSVVVNANLGEFITEKLKVPTEQQIKEKVKQLNPKLDINKIKIENITNNSAKINSLDSSVYNGTVTVNYSVSITSLNW
ncbi:hypothetical protein [Spiroplasma endosymbiont of Eupeodes luniger]|uniref:hypothetical protein n=1 Tax=Spiroplasma endosymbiont of Eupeodes luniger TaxID=3066300 RepID=UPI0030CD41CA